VPVQGKRMIGENDLRVYLDKFDKKYWASYKVLDILQKVFYRSASCHQAASPLLHSELKASRPKSDTLLMPLRACERLGLALLPLPCCIHCDEFKCLKQSGVVHCCGCCEERHVLLCASAV